MGSKQKELDDIFLALSHPRRRTMLRRLLRGPASPSDLSRLVPISLNSTCKHIAILERAGLVQRELVGHAYQLTLLPQPYEEAERWLDAHHPSRRRRRRR